MVGIIDGLDTINNYGYNEGDNGGIIDGINVEINYFSDEGAQGANIDGFGDVINNGSNEGAKGLIIDGLQIVINDGSDECTKDQPIDDLSAIINDGNNECAKGVIQYNQQNITTLIGLMKKLDNLTKPRCDDVNYKIIKRNLTKQIQYDTESDDNIDMIEYYSIEDSNKNLLEVDSKGIGLNINEEILIKSLKEWNVGDECQVPKESNPPIGCGNSKKIFWKIKIRCESFQL